MTLAELKAQLKETIERREKATPGPWHVSGQEYKNHVIQTSHFTRDVWDVAECHHDGEVDADFICIAGNHAATHARLLLEAIEVLTVIGNSRALNGDDTASAKYARDFLNKLTTQGSEREER